MAALNDVLSIASEHWTLRLRTAADPDAQLSSLAALLGKAPSDPSLAPKVEANPPIGAPGLVKAVFENCIYTLRVEPVDGCSIESVRNPVLRDLEDSLECDDGIWRGSLRTGNDIGWYPIEIATRLKDGSRQIDRIAWLVRPSKLDYASDLAALTKAVEAEYPLWLFKFRVPTVHEAASSRSRGERFLLLWAAQFEILRRELEKGCRIVAQNPHISLEAERRRFAADRLKGRLPRSCEESLAEGRSIPGRRYETDIWSSSLDTPENRFIAFVLDSCLSGLERFCDAVGASGISPSFAEKIDLWMRSLRTIRADSMFKGLSEYAGMAGESLVLHNKAGYSKVYRSWLELRHYMDFFARSSSTMLGMRSISELYEIWCFLEVKRIIKGLPGFDEINESPPRWRKGSFERELVDGRGAAFRFSGPGGLEVFLSHEPIYGPNSDSLLSSLTVAQKPDIVLEANWPATWERPERRLLWIFDAKYRVKNRNDEGGWDRDEGSGRSSECLVPPDALDQMHRYRDAILSRGPRSKERPVLSAFALYPGRFDQTLPVSANPYARAIDEVGIGAFPLLPGEGGAIWLSTFLARELATASPSLITSRPSVRIPVSGLAYPEEDVLIVFLSSDRDAAYLDRFRKGYAKGYHTYVAGGPSEKRLDKVRFLATIDVSQGGEGRMIRGVYALDGPVDVRKRNSLSRDETGNGAPRHPQSDVHWLPLGRYLQLPKPLPVRHDGGNWYRYASLNRLFEAKEFSELWLLSEEAEQG